MRTGGVTDAPEVERAAECAEPDKPTVRLVGSHLHARHLVGSHLHAEPNKPTVPERVENVSPARAVPTRSARPAPAPAALLEYIRPAPISRSLDLPPRSAPLHTRTCRRHV